MHSHDLRHLADGVLGAAAIASTVLANPLLRPFHRKWGATEHEARRLLPGDALIEEPRLRYTRAISIAASPERVWPWLVQMGYRRAGWYSYDLLEDVAGAGEFVTGDSAEQVIPDLQQLAVGDELRLSEQIGFRVERLEPAKLLLVSDARDNHSGERFDLARAGRPADFRALTWALYLDEPESSDTEFRGGTRLSSRWRIDYTPRRSNEVMWKLFVEPINFVMERRMLLGLKRRAEHESR